MWRARRYGSVHISSFLGGETQNVIRGISTNTIREKFTDFFIQNGYSPLRSVSVVPQNDPTLLFTSAGMVPFKDNILNPDPDSSINTRITTVQKCVRAGGKDCDLENVGTSKRHLSFFEMCGFFQLPPANPDYKRDSLYLAMQFLTKELRLDHRRLKVTVHESDIETKDLWARDHGKHAYVCNSEHNFWSMGSEKGLPCGPCTEIYYDFSDHSSQYSSVKDVAPPDDDHCLEIWNLVFMQYKHHGMINTGYDWDPAIWEKLVGGNCVDTGMGLERLASVVQGATSNFGIDSLQTIINHARTTLSNLTNKDIPYADFGRAEHENPHVQESSVSLRIIADHIRAASIMISDGVTPTATGRGYVLRRIIRRLILQTHLLGIQEPCLHLIYPSVLQTLGGTYPELIERQSTICQILQQEEQFFHKIIHQGLRVLNEYMDSSEGRSTSLSNPLSTRVNPVLPPKLVFSLYDSMGFPMDLTHLYAKKQGYEIDFTAVNNLLEEQRERSRRSWKNLCGFHFLRNGIRDSLSPTENITFTGYQQTRESSKLLAYAVDEANKAQDKNIFICIDPCPFYAEGGGQIGDSGYLEFITGERIQIDNCIKMNDAHVLLTKYSEATWQCLESYQNYGNPNFIQAVVHQSQRQYASQNHTATHLLNSALRKVLGERTIHQAGSYVGPDRLRFDFTYPKALTKEQLQSIEKLVRSYIRQNLSVETKLQSYDVAIANGAISLDSCGKYGDTVRVVEIFDPAHERFVSRELCGGTHVKSTSVLAPFLIVNESSVAAGVRRIEALTGEMAEQFIEENLNRVQTVAQMLGTSTNEIDSSAKQLVMKRRALEIEIEKLQQKVLSQSRVVPLCGIPPGESQEMKIHIIKNEENEIDNKDKKAKKAEMNNLKGLLNKWGKEEPQSTHILVKGRTAICTDCTAKQKLQKVLEFLGGSIRGAGNNFAIGELPSDIDDSCTKRLSSWLKITK